MKKLFTSLALVLLFTIGCKKKDADINPSFTKPVALDFSIPEDSIKVNVSGYAPLSALINFTAPVSGKTFISVKGKHGTNSNIEHVFDDQGTAHSIPVIGLYADYLNTVDIRLLNDKDDTVAKATVSIQTGGLPPNLPASIEADVVPHNPEKNTLYLVSNYSSINPHIPLMVDDYGDIRWLLDYTKHTTLNTLDYENGIKRLRNGNFYFEDAYSDKIYEIDLFGQILNTWDLSPTGYIFHHDIEENPDGNFIASVSKTGSTHPNGVGTIQDYIVEIDRQTANIKTVWDLKESLDENRMVLTNDQQDWIHVNSVWFDTTDNTIIVSARTQGVFKLDFNNNVKWILATHKGWGKNRRGEDLNQFLLTPLDANGTPINDTNVLNGDIGHPDFEWCWYQHSVVPMPNGDFMLFDNGYARYYNVNTPNYSRAVEYKIDPVNKTIQQIWQYGKERGTETYSFVISSVQFLPATNHVLFCPGFNVPNEKGFGGKIVEVDYATRQVVSQLSFSAANQIGFHRAKRISAYP